MENQIENEYKFIKLFRRKTPWNSNKTNANENDTKCIHSKDYLSCDKEFMTFFISAECKVPIQALFSSILLRGIIASSYALFQA